MSISNIDKSIKELERFIIITQKRLSRSPEGRIRIRRMKAGIEFRKVYYNENGKKTEKYIKKKDYKTISALANKKYCKELLPALKEELNLLKDFNEKYQPLRKYDIFEQFPNELKPYVSPVAKTVRQLAEEWEKAEFATNEYEYAQNREYVTKKGERVRSRAELIIANALLDAKIPYRYEDRLELQSGRVRFPDFTVMHPATGEFYYIEFFGKMDDPDYAADNWAKIREYSCDPIFPHMFMLFDSEYGPFDTIEINNLIKNFFCSEE